MVDSLFRTSAPGVYCVGDAAAFPLLLAGGALSRSEHVGHARASAAVAVDASLGLRSDPYDYLPMFYSRLFSYAWRFYGVRAGTATHFGLAGALVTPKRPFGALWVHNGRCVGVFVDHATSKVLDAAEAIARERPSGADVGAIVARLSASQEIPARL